VNLLNFDEHQHIFGMAKARVNKFFYTSRLYKEDESPLKGAWSGSRDPF